MFKIKIDKEVHLEVIHFSHAQKMLASADEKRKNMTSIFRKIINRELPAYILWEDKDVIAFFYPMTILLTKDIYLLSQK